MKANKSGASFNRFGSNQDYRTPDDFMTAIKNRFGKIDFDLAASASNAKASHFYSEKDNSLAQNWGDLSGTLWLNPPFSDIAPWAKKCRWHCERDRSRILLLTPASVGSEWFAEYVHNHAIVLALSPRLSFDGKSPYPKDIILSGFGFSRIGFELWRWK